MQLARLLHHCYDEIAMIFVRKWRARCKLVTLDFEPSDGLHLVTEAFERKS